MKAQFLRLAFPETALRVVEFQGPTPPVLAWCCRGVGAPGAVTRPGPGLLSQWVGRVSLLLPAWARRPSYRTEQQIDVFLSLSLPLKSIKEI